MKKVTKTPGTNPKKAPSFTAKAFVDELKTHQSAVEKKKIQQYFKSDKGEYGEGDEFMGVRMGTVFAVAKTFIDMAPKEIEKLLENRIHEVRAGAVSIMDFQARAKKTSEIRRKELYELYIRRHDRINNWDLVDRAAPHVVGGYLFDKSRAVLYKLAKSRNMWNDGHPLLPRSSSSVRARLTTHFNSQKCYCTTNRI